MKSLSNIRKKVGDPVAKWYGKYERPISSLSLIGGFVFDAVTLKRVDAVWENVWVIGHIILIAIVMIFVNWIENEPGDEKNPEKIHFWLVNILQFLFGGVLSVFLVFYFRSADLSTSWPFLLILALVFWANESLKRRFVRLTFQVALLFLSIFSTNIFLLPVLFHRIGTDIFLYSGFVSLITIFVFILLLSWVSKEKFKKNRLYIHLSIVGVYIGMNFLYFTNLIPPIPISLEDSGIYYSIYKDDNNDYVGTYKYIGLISHILFYPKVSVAGVDSLYAYSAVFSPTYFDTSVYHEWQYYDEEKEDWTNMSVVPLKIVGGREGGFRTYSRYINPLPGKWRVNVLTSLGHVVGRIRFEVVTYEQKGEMREKVLD